MGRPSAWLLVLAIQNSIGCSSRFRGLTDLPWPHPGASCVILAADRN